MKPRILNSLLNPLVILTTVLLLTFSTMGSIPAQAQPLSAPPALGTYPATNMVLGSNTSVTPSTTPTDTTSINVSASADFKGTFIADPTTGVIRIINAHPAGTYTVVIKAFGAVDSIVTTFPLTVISGTACTATPGFSGTTNTSVGSGPYSIAVGDFNNDGKQDFAAASWGLGNISIRLGDGAGGFSGSTSVSVGTAPASVAVGDFNNDGKQDIAAANYNSNTVSIRLGDGAGNFSGATNINVGNGPYSIALGDFNKDGKQDFATANANSNTVSISLGDGAGGSSGLSSVMVGNTPRSIALGDFNGDGKLDFATADSSSNTITTAFGDGAGWVSGTTGIFVGGSPQSVAVGDFNNDGKLDLAVANSSFSMVSIRLGDGLGAFSGTTSASVGNSPYSVAVGDFNNDGKQDIATANYSANTVSFRLGDGAGNFSGSTNVSVGTSPLSVAVGDFNNDGKQDFATANNGSNTVSIRLGGCFAAVTYNGNSNTGGTAPVDSNSPYAVGSIVTVQGVGTLVKTGYSFNGWNTAQDGFGVSYAPAATFTINAVTTLYAQWIPNTYTVTFDGNGGGAPSPISKSVTFGNAYGTLATVSRPGYTFNGWYNAPSGGSLVTSATTVSTASDHILYAHWTVNQYIISFNSNGGSVVNPITQDYGTPVSAPANPTKTGYAFAGWYNDAGLSTAYTFSTMPAENITLYAGWTLNQYTISFNSNGGSVVDPITQDYGTPVSAPTSPTRTGHTFAGWYSDAGLNIAYTFSTMPAENITLYAGWTIHTFTLTYTADANGSITGTSPQTVNYGSDGTAVSAVPNAGYHFVKWSDNSTANPRTDINVTGNISVTATFAQDEYTLTVNSAHGTVTKNPNQATYHYGDVVTLSVSPEAGWSFSGWTPSLTDNQVTIAGNTAVTANYTQNEYTLTVNSAHGTVTKNPNQATYHYGDLVTLSVSPEAGWSFKDWTPSLTENQVTISGNMTVTANYRENPVITWADPAAINQGTPLSDAQLNATANVPGTFTYTPSSGIYLSTGTYTLHVDFVPTDAVNYTNASKDVSLTVNDHVLFNDVPDGYWARPFIERLSLNQVTGGCGGGNYCPNTNVNRAMMAIFVLRAAHGLDFTPPPATGTVFTDVLADSFGAAWIEQLSAEGITGGCGGGKYCPNTPVTRAQMAVFLVKALYGVGYTPPAASGTVFNDVPADGFAADFIEQLVADGITGGCGGGNFCPNKYITRAEMAVFLITAFNLP